MRINRRSSSYAPIFISRVPQSRKVVISLALCLHAPFCSSSSPDRAHFAGLFFPQQSWPSCQPCRCAVCAAMPANRRPGTDPAQPALTSREINIHYSQEVASLLPCSPAAKRELNLSLLLAVPPPPSRRKMGIIVRGRMVPTFIIVSECLLNVRIQSSSSSVTESAKRGRQTHGHKRILQRRRT